MTQEVWREWTDIMACAQRLNICLPCERHQRSTAEEPCLVRQARDPPQGCPSAPLPPVSLRLASCVHAEHIMGRKGAHKDPTMNLSSWWRTWMPTDKYPSVRDNNGPQTPTVIPRLGDPAAVQQQVDYSGPFCRGTSSWAF